MTTAPGHPILSNATQDVARPGLAASTIRVEWVIAIDALRAARPDLAIAASGREATLAWTITPGGEATATLEVDGAPIDFTLVPAGLGADVTIDEPTRTRHIRVPGLLELVFDRPSDDRDATDAGRLLYARSTLPSAIGLPGGSYRLVQPRRGD